MNFDDTLTLGIVVALTSMPYLIVVATKWWSWTLLPAIGVAAALAVLLASLYLGWMPADEKGLGALFVMLLLWPLIVGIGIRSLFLALSRVALGHTSRLAIAGVGWVIALTVLFLT